MGINERSNFKEIIQKYKKTKSVSQPRTIYSKLTDSELHELVAFGKSRIRRILVKYVELKRPEVLENLLKSNKPREEKLDEILKIEGAMKMDNLILNANRSAEIELKTRNKRNE